MAQDLVSENARGKALIQGKKRRISKLPLMAVVGVVFLPLNTSLAASFDGNLGRCCHLPPPNSNGAKAFTLRCSAEVKNGVIHGQYGTKDQPGSQSIDGQIEPNGTAMLTA